MVNGGFTIAISSYRRCMDMRIAAKPANFFLNAMNGVPDVARIFGITTMVNVR